MFKMVYCDYHCCNKDYDRIYRPNGGGDYLFLFFSMPMKVFLNEKLHITKPGACIIYSPEYAQDYSAAKEFRNCYVHFLADKGELEVLQIPLNQVFYPSHTKEIDSLFMQLQKEFLTKETNYLTMADALIKQMMVLVSRQFLGGSIATEEKNIYKDFREVRLKLLSQCELCWNIDSMCKLVHLEKSQFYYYYDKFFSITPKADLLNARLEKAKHLLTIETLQIQQVAELCGFENATHFTRQFKKRFELPPKEYRQPK